MLKPHQEMAAGIIRATRVGRAIKPTSIFDVVLLPAMLGRHQKRTAGTARATKVARATAVRRVVTLLTDLLPKATITSFLIRSLQNYKSRNKTAV